MKAKIYPLNVIPNEIEANASPFCLHLEIICASLAKGTSIIKNILSSHEIDTTISWCKAIGANIRKSNEKYIIKGIDNNIKYKNSLFVCGNSSTTAKMMIPLLCSVQQPFGVKTNEEIFQELCEYQSLFESYGVSFFVEKEMIRFEKIMEAKESEFDGDMDIALVAGLFLAFPLLNKQSVLKLRAPVRSEENYVTILRILKHFHIDIKHPATMRYEINGNQLYKHCKIRTEMDKFLLSHKVLLSQKLETTNSILKIFNYNGGSTQESTKLFSFIKKNIIDFAFHFPKKAIKKKTINLHKMENNVENSLPLLMVLGVLNQQDCIITHIDFSKNRVKKQFAMLSKIFTKLGLDYSSFENEVIIHPSKVKEKKQIDCENDPYIAMAITYLAILSDVPIIIKNADCIYNLYDNFFNDLKRYGVLIDFIHN